MLWYQAWLETRSRFVIGLLVLIVLAVGTVCDYLAVVKLMPLAGALPPDTTGRLRAVIELQRTFHGYVWVQWFRQTFANAGAIVAVLLGSGTVFTRGSDGAALFTLSLPVLRADVLRVRWIVGLAEWLAASIVPALTVALVAPAIGQQYAIGPAVLYGVSAFVAGTVLYSGAALLSTMFPDVWRPLLLGCGIAVVLAVVEMAVPMRGVGLFRVMSAERYFYTGAVPWIGWLSCAVISTALFAAAARRLNRRDF